MNNVLRKTIKLAAISLTLLSLMPVSSSQAKSNHIKISNPYSSVDWDEDGQYLSNLHTHTLNSDGDQTQANMFKQYQKLKYDFLAFTDHDVVMPLWPNYNINDGPTDDGIKGTGGLPAIDGWKTSDVIPIKGNEVSKTGWENHHFLSYFSDFVSDGKAQNNSELLRQCAAYDPNGLQVLAHPGRYVYQKNEGEKFWDVNDPRFTSTNPRYFNIPKEAQSKSTWDLKMNWYAKQYEEIPSLVGLEVLNYGNQYTKDRQIWDDILTKTMPSRPIWGFANDDAHFVNVPTQGLNAGCDVSSGRDMETMILHNKTVADFKQAMKNGNFVISSRYTLPEHTHNENSNDNMSPGADRTIPLPKITDVFVDKKSGRITIKGENFTSIKWISCGQEVRSVKTTVGDTIDCTNTTYPSDTINGDGIVTLKNKGKVISKYVRAVLTGPGGETFTQPFGIEMVGGK